MERKYNALSLRNINYNESDKIVTLLTLERGKLAILARGCRTAKAKLRCAVSPLCFGNYIVHEKNGRNVLTACDVIDSFQNVSDDLDKYYIASIVLEAADKFSEEDTQDNELFFLIIGALKNICYGNSPIFDGLIFLCNLLKKVGYAINIEKGVWFDYENGSLSKKPMSSYADKLTLDEAKLLADVVDESNEIKSDITNIKRIFILLNTYITFATQKKMRTIKEFLNIIN